MSRTFPSFHVVLALIGGVGSAPAAVDFVREVRPILEKHCTECHGEKKQKSGLRLDVKAAALQGGEFHGPNIVPGRATESSLIQLVTSEEKDERMPPKGEPLSTAEIATLRAWIDEGAIWPDGVDRVKLEDRRDHWSFKALGAPTPPAVKNADWPHHEMDRFILARLESEGLAPSAEAERAVWLRRVTFDLTGLPPTPEEVSAFLADSSERAHDRVVDRLLASRRHGERWAQHWLDVVRYADTHGFEVNTERPNAWPYRDYVIRALNADLPYDRFIREQIAGDALGEDAATGFLVTASVLLPGQIGKDEPSKRLARQDAIDEIVTNIGQTFLGLSIGCARCHDHKFDPISARDYYAMQGFVAGVEYGDRELRTPEAEALRREEKRLRAEVAGLELRLAKFVPLAKAGGQRPAVNARQNTDRFAPIAASRVRLTVLATNNLEPCIDELEIFDLDGISVGLASAGATVAASGEIIVADRHELRHLNDGQYGNSRSWMSNEKGKGWVEVTLARPTKIDRVVWSRDREGKFKDRLAVEYRIEIAGESGDWRLVADSTDREKLPREEKKAAPFSTKGLTPEEAQVAEGLLAEKKKLEAQVEFAANGHKVFAGTFRSPDTIHLLNRGDPEQPKAEVQPAVLSLFHEAPLAKETPEQQRRLALADWIANPRNPLTARVMVNRIWQGHFGMGLVETASDFGRMGTKPSHPELLDWLAGEFIRGGWSMKRLHRLIVLSATYRQASRLNPSAAEKDADARWLWRFPPRRLEAETIRDAMLAASGRLDLRMFGRGFDLFDKRGGLSGFKPVESFSGEGLRRMIYAHKVRREREAVFGAFDCPDAGQSAARRRESTTPIQALNLFNSRFTIDEARALAERAEHEAGADLRAKVSRMFQLTLSREPSAEELAEAEAVGREHGLEPLARAIFNSNEFLFLP